MKEAVAYAQNGWALVPIPKGKKGPITPGWNRLENVITDPEVAAAHTGNIGIAHAYCTPNPTVALDIDDMALAHAWLLERGVDLDALLGADDAVQIVSGRPDRAKLVYRLPPGLDPIRTVQIKGPGGNVILEIRCAAGTGLTMQDVLPPSIHPETGLPYQWGGKGNWRNLPEIPKVLLQLWSSEFCAGLPRRMNRGTNLTFSRAVDDTPRHRAQVADMVSHISADCSYDLYRDVVWAHLSLAWHDAEELAKLWCLSAPGRFEEPNFNTVVTTYDETRTPGFGTIVYYARAGGWNG